MDALNLWELIQYLSPGTCFFFSWELGIVSPHTSCQLGRSTPWAYTNIEKKTMLH